MGEPIKAVGMSFFVGRRSGPDKGETPLPLMHNGRKKAQYPMRPVEAGVSPANLQGGIAADTAATTSATNAIRSRRCALRLAHPAVFALIERT